MVSLMLGVDLAAHVGKRGRGRFLQGDGGAPLFRNSRIISITLTFLIKMRRQGLDTCRCLGRAGLIQTRIPSKKGLAGPHGACVRFQCDALAGVEERFCRIKTCQTFSSFSLLGFSDADVGVCNPVLYLHDQPTTLHHSHHPAAGNRTNLHHEIPNRINIHLAPIPKSHKYHKSHTEVLNQFFFFVYLLLNISVRLMKLTRHEINFDPRLISLCVNPFGRNCTETQRF